MRLPDQGHTQSVGSAESFAAQYEFFTGHAPGTTMVLPEPPGQVEIAGRAVSFPANTGLVGSILDVYEVKPESGERKSDTPRHTVSIGADGNFGPLDVNGRKHYELQITRDSPDGPRLQHFYYEPFLRSNSLIRLNLSPLDSAPSQAIDRGPHTSVSVVRQKEWWGNNPVDPTNVDSLEITTRSGGETERAGNIINSATAPFTGSTIAVITFDDNVGRDHQHRPAGSAAGLPHRSRRLHAGDRAPRGHDQVPPRAAPRRPSGAQHTELVLGGRARDDGHVPRLGPGHRHMERVQAGEAQSLLTAPAPTLNT